MSDPISSGDETLAIPQVEGPGGRIGPFKILQQIGEGGFGSVFEAEQEHPVKRRVALKVIKLGMDTREVIARFEAERQALALMDHPHIARVLDAGATDSGRPYFVMELVKGEPISGYCSRHKLPIAERLQLFGQVCEAVQHAHTKGIIHRDLKPNNVLVSTQDDRPFAKVIDFGIAKATSGRLTDKTLFTEMNLMMGTPLYMSPEQAEGSADIDTRTDIYSLGVILYELLTDTTPIDSNTLRTAGYAEIQRIIREVEPPRPSARLSKSTTTKLGAEARQPGDSRRLTKMVRGELDWIVMKAIEKNRARRYETANGLAMDVRRYLAGEAVLAAPPSAIYRMQKFVRRNKTVVATGSLVAIALLVGIAGFAWQARIAERERAVAERRFEDVRTFAHAMLYNLNDELVKVPGTTPARKVLVQEAQTYLQKLSAENNTSLPMRRELAGAWMRLGDVQGGGGANIGDLKGALVSFAQARRQIEAVLRTTPNDVKTRSLHASILMHQGDAMYQSNALTDAERNYRQGLTEWTELARHDPADRVAIAEGHDGLGNVMFWTNKLDLALREYTQAQAMLEAIGPGKDARRYAIELGTYQQERGYTQGWLNHKLQARELLGQSIATLQAWLQAHPEDPAAIQVMAVSWMYLGEDDEDLPDRQPMLDAYTHYHDAYALLVTADPANANARRHLAVGDQKLGDVHALMHEDDLALASYHKALATQQAMVAHDPSDKDTASGMAESWYDIGVLQKNRGDLQAAVAAYRQALALRQSFVKQDPNAAMEIRDVAVVEGDLADALADPAEACRYHLASDALWQRLVKQGSAAPSDHQAIERVHKQAAACN